MGVLVSLDQPSGSPQVQGSTRETPTNAAVQTQLGQPGRKAGHDYNWMSIPRLGLPDLKEFPTPVVFEADDPPHHRY